MAPTIRTTTGTFIGHMNQGFEEYLGIRYAAPLQKFRAPQPPATGPDDIFEAKAFGPACIQPKLPDEKASEGPMAEDCLTLNIWTKSSAKAAGDVSGRFGAASKKPVLMFYHGGGYVAGGTSDPIYHGLKFLQSIPDDEDIVVVTSNYRLGIYGSLDLSVLEGYTDEYYSAINNQVLDQRLALKWVHDNITFFGGDPDNVTVMGQSAGARSIFFLMTDPQSAGYFHHAIEMSGPPGFRFMNKETAEENARKVFDVLGVHTLEEFLAIPEDDIKNKYIEDINNCASLGMRYLDGKIISETCWDDLKNGCAKHVDFIIGCTGGEMDNLVIDPDNFPHAGTNYQTVLDRMVLSRHDIGHGHVYGALDYAEHPDIVQAFLDADQAAGGQSDGSLLNRERCCDPMRRTMTLCREFVSAHGSRNAAAAQSKWNPNTFLYRFDYAPNPQDVIDLMGEEAEISPWGRALHCMDLMFALGNLEDWPRLLGPVDKLPSELLHQVQASIYAFMKTGDPNCGAIPVWKPYDETDHNMMIIDREWMPAADPFRADREILEPIRPTDESAE